MLCNMSTPTKENLPALLGLDMYIIWSTNRKVHILVKMSYNPSQLRDQRPSYGFPKNSASFAKMAV